MRNESRGFRITLTLVWTIVTVAIAVSAAVANPPASLNAMTDDEQIECYIRVQRLTAAVANALASDGNDEVSTVSSIDREAALQVCAKHVAMEAWCPRSIASDNMRATSTAVFGCVFPGRPPLPIEKCPSGSVPSLVDAAGNELACRFTGDVVQAPMGGGWVDRAQRIIEDAVQHIIEWWETLE